jgi:uncharacterized membrane protein
MISLIYSLFFFLHPIHISVSEINYSEKDKALQITTRIYIDDLELSVRAQRNEPELDLIEPKNGHTTEKMVNEYVAKHLSVKLDGKIQKLTFLGMEREDPALICYIEIENVKKFKTVEVRNDIIMETHDDQSNLVHVTYKGSTKSMRLVRSNPIGSVAFESK